METPEWAQEERIRSEDSGESSNVKLPWVKRWVADHLGSIRVRFMSFEAIGLYTMCLFTEWRDGPLPKDVRDLAKLLGRPVDEVSAIWPQVVQAFTETPAGWINLRLESGRAIQTKEYLDKSAAGRKGRKRSGEKRREQADRSRASRLLGAKSKQIRIRLNSTIRGRE